MPIIWQDVNVLLILSLVLSAIAFCSSISLLRMLGYLTVDLEPLVVRENISRIKFLLVFTLIAWCCFVVVFSLVKTTLLFSVVFFALSLGAAGLFGVNLALLIWAFWVITGR